MDTNLTIRHVSGICWKLITSRFKLLNDILNSVNDLVILTAHGYAQIVLLRDNVAATLKTTKYDEDDLEIAPRKVAKAVSRESSEFHYSRHAYKRLLSKSIAGETVSETLLKWNNVVCLGMP